MAAPQSGTWGLALCRHPRLARALQPSWWAFTTASQPSFGSRPLGGRLGGQVPAAAGARLESAQLLLHRCAGS
eukprot:8173139-Alexandrium_andersonii.AAC.1